MSNEFLLFAFSVSALLCGHSNRTPLNTTEPLTGDAENAKRRNTGQEDLK
jgi:hypothetical protein